MVTELKILNLAFRPLSDDSTDENIELGDDEELDGDKEEEDDEDKPEEES
jgi:hypothetical protein